MYRAAMKRMKPAARRALAFAYSEPGGEAMWPLAYLAFIVLYQVTESTIFVGNTILWMVYVSTVCSVSDAVPTDSAVSDYLTESAAEEDSVFEPQPSFAATKGYL